MEQLKLYFKNGGVWFKETQTRAVSCQKEGKGWDMELALNKTDCKESQSKQRKTVPNQQQ